VAIAGARASYFRAARHPFDPDFALTVHGQFFGFIGFDNCVQARMWEVSEVDSWRGGSHFASAEQAESLLLGQNEYLE